MGLRIKVEDHSVDIIKPISKAEGKNINKDFDDILDSYMDKAKQMSVNECKKKVNIVSNDKYEIKDTVEISSYYVGDKEEK